MPTTFTTVQYDCAYPDGIEFHWWNRARGRILRHRLQRLREPRPKIIEVGCGRGLVVSYLRSHGFDCKGVELAMVEPLASMEAHVHRGMRAEDLPGDERQGYEVLLLLDVLEHIEDPCRFLAGLLAAFPGLRHVLVTVPAGPELWSNYDEYFGHYRRYRLDMLEDFSTRSPLELVDGCYFFHAPYLPLRFMKFLGRSRETALRPPAQSSRWIHSFLANMMFLDYLLLPKQMPGTSIMASFSIRQA